MPEKGDPMKSRSAKAQNAFKPGTDIIRELNHKKLKELCGWDPGKAKYPLYVWMDEPR